MASKESIYGLFGPKKLNPNLIAAGAIIIALTLILVYSGRHSKITVTRDFSIETNIPPSPDSAKPKNP